MEPRSAVRPTEPHAADECQSFYEALPDARGAGLVDLLLAADLACISELEWENAQLQFAIANEANVLEVARALPTAIGIYDGFSNSRLIKLMRFLRVLADILEWCISFGPGAGGSCRDEVWQSAQGWDIDPGSPVHKAVADAVEAFRMNPHFGNRNDSHSRTLLELTRLIRDYEQPADHVGMAVWWLTHRTERQLSEMDVWILDAMFDVLGSGHQNEGRFVSVFGESRELLDVLLSRALDSSLVGTDAEFVATRSALEIGRFSKYPGTTNYVRVREAVASIRQAYENDETLRVVWWRVVAELDYNDPQNCQHYGTCEWYAGGAFNANFRSKLFSRRLQCPVSYCSEDSVTVHGQDLSDDQLALACERLDGVADTFHNLFPTYCEPVANDFSDGLDIYVFGDIRSCEDYASAAFFHDADVCSGIYYEMDPAEPGNRPQAVVTEYEAWENPPDPRLSIWNLEHEYVHYLDGRYNRYDGYRGEIDSMHWWTEGVAEYVAALSSPTIDPPPFRSSYNLAQILLHSDSLPTGYSDRHLAVRFFMENHRDFVDVVLAQMRRGRFDAYQTFLEGETERYASEFDGWLRMGGRKERPRRRETTHLLVPLFPASIEGGRHGLLRVVNLSDQDGDVEIVAVDDGGTRFEPITLSLSAFEVARLDSHDLENGNVDKGLAQGVGQGEGDWWLQFSSQLEVLVLAYIQTPDGFIAPMSDVVARDDGGYLVSTFDPSEPSLLRIGNLGEADAEVTISGMDDAGMESWQVRIRIGGFATTTLDPESLRAAGAQFPGNLDPDAGNVRLVVSSPQPLFVMSLLESSGGVLENLSAAPPDRDVP